MCAGCTISVLLKYLHVLLIGRGESTLVVSSRNRMALLATVRADDDPAFAAHLRPKPISSHPCSGPDCLKLGVLKCSRCHAGEQLITDQL